jgi:hypothetical protein
MEVIAVAADKSWPHSNGGEPHALRHDANQPAHEGKRDLVGDKRSNRRLLAMVRPPKPVSQMTDGEIDRFCDEVFARVRAAHEANGP